MTALILVVEDDPTMRRYVGEALEKNGFRHRAVGSGEAALAETEKVNFDLVILDVGLPGMDGFALCRQLRASAKTSAIPLIFLTVRQEEAVKVAGLELGADDYVTKPFGALELMARVRAVLRRRQSAEFEESLKSGSLTVDVPGRLVTAGRKAVPLTAKGFDLLCLFLRKKGRVLKRSYLMEILWGQDYSESTRTVDTHVYMLRKQLGRHGACLKSVEGVGYKWEDE